MSPIPKGKSFLKFFGLLLTALPSIIFGVFTILFTLNQNEMARKDREQDQRLANEQSIRTTFENYIGDISSLLLDEKFDRSKIEHLLHIQVKTLTALRYLDGTRRRDVVLFLYESGLLRTTNDGKPSLQLTNANLTDVEFIGTPTMKMKLDHLNLAGVFAPNIVFNWCSLSYASFDRATLINAEFSSTTLINASFYAIFGSRSTMKDVMFLGNNFRDSKLQGIRLIGVSTMGPIDMTNVDLYDNGKSFDPDMLHMMLASPLFTFKNARLADGSYGPIDHSNQIRDGDAEEACGNGRQSWNFSHSGHDLSMEITSTRTLLDLADRDQFGHCSFVARNLGRATITQEVHVPSFSVLIDADAASYHLTATLGCYGSHENRINLAMEFYKENHLWIDGHQKPNTTDVPQTSTLIGRIPRETRLVLIRIESTIVDPNGFCLADNLKMNILRN